MPTETRTTGSATAVSRSETLARELAGLDALETQPAPRRRAGVAIWEALWPKLLAIALFLVFWQLVVWSGWRKPYQLPGPAPVIAKLGHLASTASYWKAISVTLRRAATGYALAVAIGTLVGLAVARFRTLRVGVGSFITGLQTMPSIAWFPLAVLLFQLSEGAILFVIVLGAAPSIANGLLSGVDHVPPLLTRAGKVLGARGISLYRHVVLPAALPGFIGGLKQGWAFVWRSLMAGELLVIIANRPSIGARLQFARELSDSPLLIAYMITVLLVGIVVDALFSRAERSLRRKRGLLADR